MHRKISRAFLLAIGLACGSSDHGVSAQAGATDTFTFFGVGQPQGPVAASYLRMNHALALLDMCRQVRAGALDRQQVEGFVGQNALNALLAMDLDGLRQKLTAPHDPAQPPSPNSLWNQILTNGGTAPVPPADLPERLTLRGLGAGGFPSQLVRVTSPIDGALGADLSDEGPFRILSMRTYDGVIVQEPVLPNRSERETRETAFEVNPHRNGGAAATFQSLAFSRTEGPWTVPVRAGQDVDVEIGLASGTVVPPGGLTASVTLGDPLRQLWQQSIGIDALSPLPGGTIFVPILTPQLSFDTIQPLAFTPATFTVPMTLASPVPAVMVKGTVSPLSLPAGASMPTFSFVLQPQGSQNASFVVSIANSSQAWNTTYVPQAFSIKVSYQTLSPPFASRTDVLNFTFTVYRNAESWKAAGSAGDVNCGHSVVLFADGSLIHSGRCDNNNFHNADVIAQGTLAGIRVVNLVFHMGFFDFDYQGFSFNWAFGQANFIFLRTQPLLMSWTKT